MDTSTRAELHRLASHILARRRFDVSGRLGLRASPGGFATPAFGDGPEVLRVSGTTLVREMAGKVVAAPIIGSSLRSLAVFGGVDLGVDFSAGGATPPLGDVDAPIALDAETVASIAAWYDLAWRVLDGVIADLTEAAAPATIQLWPEHFDAATNVGVGPDERVNLGFSAGDSFESEPYAYLGPWSSRRPGDRAYWNAPFGAVLRRSDAEASARPGDVCLEFFWTGLRLVAGNA